MRKYQKLYIIRFLLLLACIVCVANSYSDTYETIFNDISKHVKRINEVTPSDLKRKIPGQYKSKGKTLSKKMGPGSLSGSDIYIFPDGTYIYTAWSDIMSTTIIQKGNWSICEKFVCFESDNSLGEEKYLDDKYLPFRLSGKNIFLMGTDWKYDFFKKEKDRDPELVLMLVSYEFDKKIKMREVKKIKKRLMDNAWRPELFKK